MRPECWFLCGLLAVAAATDVLHRRISNSVVLAIAVAGLVLRAWTGGIGGGALALLTGVTIGGLLVLPWSVHIIGGGDLKLVAATAMAVDPGRLLVFLAGTAIAGGLLSMGMVLTGFGHAAGTTSAAAGPPVRSISARAVPYGVAIAAGGLYALLGGRG